MYFTFYAVCGFLNNSPILYVEYIYLLCYNYNMLESKDLILREMTEADTDDLLIMFSDPKVMASFDDIIFDRAMMKKWVRRNLDHVAKYGYGLFSIIHKADNVLVGDCGLERMEVDGCPEVEIGYDLRSDYWNRGYATQAAAAVRDFAFEQLRLPRVIGLVRPGNIASQRVAEKIGMTVEKEISRGRARYQIYALSNRNLQKAD